MSRREDRVRPATAGVAVPSDRRFRRPDFRPGRRKPTMRALRRLVRIGLPLLAVLVAGAWLAGRVSDASFLQVDRIVVRGAVRLTQADVELLVDGLRGTSILEADLDAYRARVLESTWVQDATISRLLPSTIEIRVVERTPIAVTRVGRDLQMVDAAGVLIESYAAAHHDLSLPIVDGLIRRDGEGLSAVDPDAMAATAAFLAAIAPDPELHDRVSEIDVRNPNDVVVLIDGDPAWLHLGDEAFVERLRRYLEWAPALRPDEGELDYVDLRSGERIVVRTAGRRTGRSQD